jgi:hypothetical protein
MAVDSSNLATWKAMQKKHRAQKAKSSRALKSGDGGSTSDDMIPLKDYVDSRDDAVESRLTQKLDKLSTKGTVWAALATGVGIMLAVWAIGGDRFDSGLSISPAFQEAAMKQGAVDNQQDANIAKVNAKLDILIDRTAPENANQTAEKLRGN